VLAVPDQAGRRSLARRIVRDGLSVRAAEQAARSAGARRRVRRSSEVDPEVAARIKDALRVLTGLDARVASNSVQLSVEGAVGLEELAESLDRVLGR